MVFTSRIDGKGPVNLLAENQPCQLMGQSDAPHGKFQGRCRFDFWGKAMGGTNHKGNISCPFQRPLGYKAGQLFARKQLAFYTQGHNTGALAHIG